MSINNYNGLEDAILAWCKRTLTDIEFVAQVPVFITLAEQQIFLDIPTLGNQLYVTGIFSETHPLYPKPALWGRTLTLECLDSAVVDDLQAKTHVIQRVSYEVGIQYKKTFAQTGLPLYYTDFSYNFIEVFPAPDQAYPFQLAYYTQIPPLTVNNQTNWTTQNAPDMLFYLAMSKAQLYLQDFQSADAWEAKYKDRAKILNDYDQERLYDRTAEVTTKAIPFQPPQGV